MAIKYLRYALLAVTCLTFMGCLAERQGLSKEEAERVLWYIEDVARAHNRSPLELVTPDASPGLQRIASWCMGTVKDGTSIEHPHVIQQRRQRWPLLKNGLRQQMIRSTDDGLLELTGTGDNETRALVEDAIRQENIDRLTTASIILSRGSMKTSSPRGQKLLEDLLSIRRQQDAAAAAGK